MADIASAASAKADIVWFQRRIHALWSRLAHLSMRCESAKADFALFQPRFQPPGLNRLG